MNGFHGVVLLLVLALGAAGIFSQAADPTSAPTPASAPAVGTSKGPASGPVVGHVERRYEFLRPAEFRRLREEVPVAIIPWGSHEWHSLHLPLGTDSVKAHWLCLALADRIGGIVYPPVYLGFGVMTNPGKDCTMGFTRDLVQQTARQYYLKLYEHGFKVVVVVMGHYGKAHTIAMEETAQAVEKELEGQMVIMTIPDYEWTAPEFRGDHAAANETSYMMLFEPRTVNLGRLPTVAEEKSIYPLGAQGPDPRTEASVERGQKQLDRFLSKGVPAVESALKKIKK